MSVVITVALGLLMGVMAVFGLEYLEEPP